MQQQITAGHCVRSISIPTFAGVTSYQISPNASLGLDPDATVYAVAARTSTGGFINVLQSVGELGAISRGQNGMLINLRLIGGDMLAEGMPFNGRRTFESNSFIHNILYFSPRKVKEIDWERSTLNVVAQQVPQLVDGDQLELLIFYTTNCWKELAEYGIMSGRKQPYLRYKRIELATPTNGSSPVYLSRTGTIGISDDAILVGVDLTHFESSERYTYTAGIGEQQVQGALLSLFRGSEQFIENYPIELSAGRNATAGLGINRTPGADWETGYFPIEPTRVGEIDWQRSKVDYKAGNTPPAGHRSTIILIYADHI